MPLYEYRCKACGYSFEKIQSFSAAPETVCPKCSGELVRPMTAPALQFKGSGWYINDYASKGSGASSETAPAESKSADTASKPAESAPSASAAPASAAPAAAPAASSTVTPS